MEENCKHVEKKMYVDYLDAIFRVSINKLIFMNLLESILNMDSKYNTFANFPDICASFLAMNYS